MKPKVKRSGDRVFMEKDPRNDAEIVDTLRRRGSVKRLDPRDYPLPCISVSSRPVEASRGGGFIAGQTVKLSVYGNRHLMLDANVRATVVSILDDGHLLRLRFANRPTTEIYGAAMWVKA